MSEQKTVRVRIAVAVGDDGAWNSCGWQFPKSETTDVELMGIALEVMEQAVVNVHWVEADIPIPVGVTVEGTVSAPEDGK
jgi:hypothetical protein